jgi:hypothetical protein
MTMVKDENLVNVFLDESFKKNGTFSGAAGAVGCILQMVLDGSMDKFDAKRMLRKQIESLKEEA